VSCIPTLVQTYQSIIHVFSFLLLEDMRNQRILYEVQQYSLGLHFLLFMRFQFLWTRGTWNHILNILFEFILLQEKENIVLPSPKICFPFQLVLNLQSAHHCDLPRTKNKKLLQHLCCTSNLQQQCVLRDDSLSTFKASALVPCQFFMQLISNLKITSK